MRNKLWSTFLFFVFAKLSFCQKSFHVQLIVQPQSTAILGDVMVFNKTSYSIVNGYVTYAKLDKSYNAKIATGISAEYNFTNKLGICSGIIFSAQGQKYKDHVQSGTWYDTFSTDYSQQYIVETNKTDLSYLKIPIQLHLNSDTTKRISFSFYGGIYVGFLVNYINEYYSFDSGTNYSSSTSTSFTEEYYVTTSGKKMRRNGSNIFSNSPGGSFDINYDLTRRAYRLLDVGGKVGVGMNIKLSDKFSIPILLNYEIGFSDIKNHKCEVVDNYYNPPTKNLYWGDSKSAGYMPYRNMLLGFQVGLKMKIGS